MRFGGTTMSIILTERSRASALGNSLKGCSQRPRTHLRSGPSNPVPSPGSDFPVITGPKKQAGQHLVSLAGCSRLPHPSGGDPHSKPTRASGRTKLLSLIGPGGMGEVYRALDTRLGRDVAIKVLPESFAKDRERMRRFAQEARSVAVLNHPNILAIYDVGEDNGSPYMVTELL